MQLILTTVASIATILLLLSLFSILFPIKKLGLESRKQAAQAAFGWLIIASGSLFALGLMAPEDAVNLSAENLPVENTPEQQQANRATESVVVAQSDSWKPGAVAAVRDEQSVVEAMFPDGASSSFWVSMRDDGSRRDGFAEYICLVLKDNGMPDGMFLIIRIWDATRLSADELHEIGRNRCQAS